MSQDEKGQAVQARLEQAAKLEHQRRLADKIFDTFMQISQASTPLLADSADYVKRYAVRIMRVSGASAEQVELVMRQALQASPTQFCLTCIQLHGFSFGIGPQNGRCGCCGRTGIIWPGVKECINVAALCWAQLPDRCDVCQAPVFNLKKSIMRGRDLCCDACVLKSNDRLVQRVKRHFGGAVNG